VWEADLYFFLFVSLLLFSFLFLFFFPPPLYIMHYGHIQVCIPCMHVCIQHGVYVYMHTYLPIFPTRPQTLPCYLDSNL